MSYNYDLWLNDSFAYERYAGSDEEYDVDEYGNVMDEQYYKDREADMEYDRRREGFYEHY